MLGKVEVAAKTTKIPLFRTLLNGVAIQDAVVTADALHAQRGRAEYLHASPELSQACLTRLDSRQARRAVTLLARTSSDDPDAEALLSQTLPDGIRNHAPLARRCRGIRKTGSRTAGVCGS